jgi:hypothetical protein
MSALGHAEMCGAAKDVRFGSKADMRGATWMSALPKADLLEGTE